ncbi:MAG: methionyl-tRNA formyltransferase [Elusimicrobia bacterium]|nr:methionyl-tRNA formyltransferase [Elusimicrobiota bacterium]
MKILFFGTPAVALPFLSRLCGVHTVEAVITRPDRPSARGQKITAPPVKTLAIENNIPVFQPERFDDAIVTSLRAYSADVGVVVSYGNLIPENIFTLPVHGCFNIHFSLLPQYRGAAPIQHALIHGESVTGVSSFWLEKTLDSGPLLLQEKVAISVADDAVSLKETLISRGVELMMRTLDKISAGPCAGIPQDGVVTFAPSLKKDHGRIDWSKSAQEIVNLIRGTKPWPGAYTIVQDGKMAGKRLKILRAAVVSPDDFSAIVPPVAPGCVVALHPAAGFSVQCGTGILLVSEVQRENGSAMSAWAFLQGASLNPGMYV